MAKGKHKGLVIKGSAHLGKKSGKKRRGKKGGGKKRRSKR